MGTVELEPSSSRVTYAGKLALSQWRDGEDERRAHDTNRRRRRGTRSGRPMSRVGRIIKEVVRAVRLMEQVLVTRQNPRPRRAGCAMPWNDPTIDLEFVAAFIDGRLSAGERTRAMGLLAESDEALELFGTAFRVCRARSGRTIVPISAARLWKQASTAWPSAAAAVLAVVMLSRSNGSRPEPGGALQYATALARNATFTGNSAGDAGANWQQRRWSVTRGGPQPETVRVASGRGSSEIRYAFRLGVRSVDLQVALGRRDTALARNLVSEVIDELTAVGLSETVVLQYTELRSRLSTDAIGRSVERASSAEGSLRVFLDSSSFAFGQWVAAAELAARTHNPSFFQSSPGARFVWPPDAAGGVTAAEAEVLRSIDDGLKHGPSDQALEKVHAALLAILQLRGG